MSTAKTGATMTTDCINLVNKNDTRCILFPLNKEIPDSRGTDSNKHLNKIRA